MKIPVKAGWIAVAGAVFLGLNVVPVTRGQQAQDTQQAAVPDAPAPQQQQKLSITDAAGGPIRPGGGAGTETGASGSTDMPDTAPMKQAPPVQPQAPPQGPPPQIGNAEDLGKIIHIYTTWVTVPVTVKDSKGKLVPGLTWRDFKVYENGTPETMKFFSVDARPISMAFVVDQSLPADVMARVNDSLGALQGGLTAWDEISVFSYANGAHNQSAGFTGAQSARVPYVLAMTKASGSDMQVPVNSGPMAGCSIRQNGNCVDPNLQPGRSAGNGDWISIPKEIHTLNDAIFAAAKELSTRPKERLRIIYVISDGKEAGSKTPYKDVLRYLQSNHISVYGTLVGDSARWGEGYLSRFHLPFTMYDNRLVSYVTQTGGTLDSEHSVNGIEKSYQTLVSEARNQYTLVYASHESPFDSKFRSIDVRVSRPGLDVVAPRGYYPSAQDAR